MKDLASIKSVLATLKPELEKAFHVKSIGIFGSAVRADFTKESDIDLIVDFDQPIGSNRKRDYLCLKGTLRSLSMTF
jgi:predicted nucleotidyltransferase